MSPTEPRPRKLTALQKTAYHEAGHAVCDWTLGLATRRVTIIPDPELGVLGHCKGYGFQKFTPETASKAQARRLLEPYIISSLAGPVAEFLATGRRNQVGGTEDRRLANDYASYLEADNHVLGLYLDYLGGKAEQFIKWRWACVKAVAAALLDRKALSGRQVKAICNSTAYPPLPGESWSLKSAGARRRSAGA